MNKFYAMDIDKVLKVTNSNKNGLSNTEAQSRQKIYGKNVITEQKKSSFIKKFFNQLNDIMVIILILSGFFSIFISLYFKNYENLFEGVLILLICFINALIGVFQEGKAENALNELKKNTQPFAKVKRNNSISKISSQDLTIGDIVFLEAGDIVPCDIRLISSTNELKCDESCLTGESLPVLKTHNFIANINDTLFTNHKNMLYSQTHIINGHAEGVVVNIGDNTEIGKIAKNLVTTKKQLTPIQKSLKSLNQSLSIIILIICALVYVIELFKGNNSILTAFLTSITLAVAAVPESLPAIISVIMAMGISNLSKHKAIVKKLHTVEVLGCCQIICTDKTGTLTR